jgi:preprotein translocase subunit SecG
MTGFVMFLHAFVALFLIVIILMQSGRGGGLTEGFASAESIFGAKTNEFMIKATTVFATVFLITCLGLAVLSAQKGKSLMSGEIVVPAQAPVTQVAETLAEEADAQVEALEEKTTAEPSEVSVEVISEDTPIVNTP